MPEFHSFDSVEDMMDALARGEQAAIDRMTEPQRAHLQLAFTEPTYWFRMYEDILIFGESQPVEAQARREVELGGDEGEYGYAYERFKERHERGYVYGKAYSVIEPDGELGSSHVSELTQCEQTTFEHMRKYGWSLDRLHAEADAAFALAVVATLKQNWDDAHPELKGHV